MMICSVRLITILRSIVILLVLYSVNVRAQDTILLYKGKIPNTKPETARLTNSGVVNGMIFRVTTPILTAYLPEKSNATGAAVIICPGGSYKVLTYEAEGVRTAKAFAKQGVVAFVLKYRLPDDLLMTDKKIGPLQDVQQAFKVVREHAPNWGIDTNRVGIMGFSAGGHLAATAATHYQKALIENNKHVSLRPDFLILVYPVISMQNQLTHADSRRNLLGNSPARETIDLFSNEMQVDQNTPPAYITHAGDDKLVDVDNSIQFYESLRHHDVPAELHLYPHGGHGFVLKQGNTDWMRPIFAWMQRSGWIK